MQTYSCIPKQQNRRAPMMLAVFSVLLLASAIATVMQWNPVLLYQALFLLFAAAIVFILSRYFFNSYTYTITLMSGEPHLIITQRQGRRITTVYHQRLSLMKEIIECKRGEEHPRLLTVDFSYSYLISMHPDRWQTLYFLLEDHTCTSIRLECDEEFLTLLREALDYLRKTGCLSPEGEASEAEDAADSVQQVED